MGEPIFIEPHYDDIALSCGGNVAQCANTGSPRILTVFGAEPRDLSLSPFAASMHSEWGLSPGEAVGKRRQEARCAASTLGPSIQLEWLDFEDAIYRDHRYDSDEALFGEVLDGPELVNAVASAILDRCEGPIYVPMGVGDHVDHQIVFQAALRVAADGYEVYAYADLPYALYDRAFRQRLQAVRWGSSCTVPLTNEEFDRKWRAIECFRSQHTVIFADFDAPRSRFQAFHRQQSEGELAERYWRLPAET